MAESDDTRVALLDWYWRALNRSGREGEATELLTGVSADMDVPANTAYDHHHLHYRGEMDEEDLLAGAGDLYRLETVGYGLANRRLIEGDTAAAIEHLNEVTTDSQWPGFGRIAAEADLVRLGEGREGSPEDGLPGDRCRSHSRDPARSHLPPRFTPSPGSPRQAEEPGRFRIRIPSQDPPGHVRSQDRTVLERVPRAAPRDPDVLHLRVPVHDEVLVGGVF